MNTFGQELRAMRMRHSLTLKTVAVAANRSVSSISDIEHSRRPPLTADEIESVCERLNIQGEIEGLMNAAYRTDSTVKVELDTELEKDLYVTLKRSIQSELIGEVAIRKLIAELKEKLDGEGKPKAIDGRGNGVN